MTNANCTGLLVNGRTSVRWRTILTQALHQLGIHLRVIDQADLATLNNERFGVVFLDPSVTDDLESSIRHVLGTKLSSSVIVFSAVPDWQQAADCYQAGAIAYEPKPSNVNKLYESLSYLLAGRDLVSLPAENKR